MYDNFIALINCNAIIHESTSYFVMDLWCILMYITLSEENKLSKTTYEYLICFLKTKGEKMRPYECNTS